VLKSVAELWIAVNIMDVNIDASPQTSKCQERLLRADSVPEKVYQHSEKLWTIQRQLDVHTNQSKTLNKSFPVIQFLILSTFKLALHTLELQE